MKKREKSAKEPGKWRQFIFTVIINLSSVLYGFFVGWQSPAVPQLQNPESPAVGGKPVTDEGISWMNGIMFLIGNFMIMLLAVIPDKFSRKRFGYVVTLPITISWFLIIFATEHICIYIAKAISSITGACLFFLVPNYVSEISCDSIRGTLASMFGTSLHFGILLAYILGGMMSLYNLAVVGAILTALYVIVFAFMPESPVYLVRQNRMREAIRSLNWLKAGDTVVAEQTLSHLQLEVKEAACTKAAKLSDLFRDRATIKGLIIILGLYGGQQFSGIFAVISYAESIFKMSGSSLSPNMSSIIVQAIMLLGSFLSTSLMERAGRRPLLLISCAAMCMCHFVIGAFCYLQKLQYDVSVYNWIPITVLSIFMIMFALGMGNGPVVIMSEIFSRDVTSVAVTVGSIMCWISSFIVVMTFANLIAVLGIHGCFFFLAGSCACSFVFCFVLVSETKGRTREDIVEELNGSGRYKEKNVKRVIEADSVDEALV
ncbi:facilitated trehalose transporter Tret1-like [Nylanderia fulva]|uniref:facilitated trehalose transporter Tret1-like n=1 Tax=Nylanderia fulva TaxID=613905 RepID=UPI0010FB78D1|nr:facilitated trehalose transporter Tret1-like [Nylanderia fulva]